MDSARSRGRLGPFVMGVLVGLVCGVLLVWSGVVPSPLASGPAPTKGNAPSPVEEGDKTTPDKADTKEEKKTAPLEANTEGSAQVAQSPVGEFLCLQRKASAAEGRDVVQQLVAEEVSKQGVLIPTNADPGPINQVLRERGYSCSDAEIETYASKAEERKAK